MKFFKKNKKIIIMIIIILLMFVYAIAENNKNKNEFVREDEEILLNAENTNNDENRRKTKDKNGEGYDLLKEADLETEDIVEMENKDNLQESESLDIDTNLDSTKETNNNKNLSNDNIEEEKIYIYVTGQVNNPGVVALKENSRIVDAIDAAGGITDLANISKINLVYALKDGMKVNIPSDEDLKNNSDFEYITMSSGDLKNDSNYISSNSSDSSNNSDSHSSKDGETSAFSKNFVVNINLATQTELETLPGIGPSTALSIINYRKENGKFSSIEDIKNVSGIGDSKFEKIKSLIIV